MGGAAFHFCEDGAPGGFIPKRFVEAGGGDDLFFGDVAVAGFAVVAFVFFYFGFFELDEACVEWIF